VSLNERWIRLDNFRAYVGLYLNCKKSGRPRVPYVFRQIDGRWSVCVAMSESGQFQQVSFVNSVCTSGGGVHVNRVYESLWSKLAPLIAKKNKRSSHVTSGHIAGHVWLFINCRLPAPVFDSQAKEKLMSHRPVAGGALWQLPDDYVRQGRTFPTPRSRCQHSLVLMCCSRWCRVLSGKGVQFGGAGAWQTDVSDAGPPGSPVRCRRTRQGDGHASQVG
jgi:hypothetical protein